MPAGSAPSELAGGSGVAGPGRPMLRLRCHDPEGDADFGLEPRHVIEHVEQHGGEPRALVPRVLAVDLTRGVVTLEARHRALVLDDLAMQPREPVGRAHGRLGFERLLHAVDRKPKLAGGEGVGDDRELRYFRCGHLASALGQCLDLAGEPADDFDRRQRQQIAEYRLEGLRRDGIRKKRRADEVQLSRRIGKLNTRTATNK